MHRITISFEPEELDGLRRLAGEADRSHAWLVRYAVRELLDRVRAGQLELPLLAAPAPCARGGRAPVSTAGASARTPRPGRDRHRSEF